jgi:integrase
MRITYQQGTIYEAANSFFVRYSTTIDGVKKRVSHKLCDRDAKHNSVDSPAVLALRDEHMVTTRRPGPPKPSNDTLITEYWEHKYLPFIKEQLKHSTVDGYVQIWNQFLKAHFTGRTLREYETHHGSQFLTEHAKTYGRRTVAHIRSLASGIFTAAINDGEIKFNPWSEVKTKIKPKAPPETKSYTLSELEEIVTLLKDRPDGQLIVCLAGMMGLRPSEIVGLTWQDVNTEARTLRVRQAVVRGVLGTTKTDVDECLPMIQPVIGLFELWREKSRIEGVDPSWVFPNGAGNPINVLDYARAVLIPACGKKWKSLYAFRRGAASILTQLTGNPIAASQLLRHKNISVTMTAYIKADRTALSNGMKLLEESLSK